MSEATLNSKINTLSKRLVIISDLTLVENLFEGTARYEFNSKKNTKWYSVNEKGITEKEYFDFAATQTKKIANSTSRDGKIGYPAKIDEQRSIRWMTREEILQLKLSSKGISISDYVEPIDLASTSDILSLTQLSSHAFSSSYKGTGIGIYFTESGCPNTSGINAVKYTQGNTCIRGTRAHPTGVANVIQLASPNAMVYGFDQINYPTNPHNYSTPILVGSHSWANSTGETYTDEDMNMDNYIYNSRVIEFVAAGNKNNLIPDFWVSSPGKALNAITVGAIDPESGSYANYSMWINSDIRNEKPEIAMYTNVDFSSNSVMKNYYSPNGRFTGTSAATPLMAGFTSTILQQHPFFKGRPELVKALLLTASTKSVINPWDFDNRSGAANSIPQYSSAAWNTRSAYWEGSNACCFSVNNELRFTENNIQAGKRYRIAIAWLVPGTFIKTNRSISQDIDLYIYQNNSLVAKSTSAHNPFELVDFVTSTATPLTIVIKRYSNSGQGKVILGYNLWENN